MIDNQDWTGAYKELCDIITSEVEEVKHTDLWYEQVSHDMDEYPYPPSSVFFDFNASSIETIGIKAQDMSMQIRVIYAFDTLSDTFKGSLNQSIALSFNPVLRKIHKVLQNKSGDNFSSLNRIGFGRVPAVNGCICYAQTYACIIRDYSATDETETVDMTNPPIILHDGAIQPVVDITPLVPPAPEAEPLFPPIQM